MSDKITFSEELRVETEVFRSDGLFEGELTRQYGLKADMYVGDTFVSSCTVRDVSADRTLVERLAAVIARERISPARIYDYIEEELSK